MRIELNKITHFDYSMGFVPARDSVVTQNWMDEAEIGLINANAQDPQFHVNARGNWWGASDGPSLSGGGHGVSVSANVTFDDWLTAPPAMKNNDRSCPGDNNSLKGTRLHRAIHVQAGFKPLVHLTRLGGGYPTDRVAKYAHVS